MEAHFDNIQNEIIEEIRQAKYLIWVAVAWFTDKLIFQELIKKKQQGVNIQVIVNDDEINKKYGFKYDDYFETVKVKKNTVYGVVKNSGNKDIMHEKFCVIDLNTVIHGTYNWTSKAQYNDESISTTNNDIEYTKKFADRFIKIKNEARNTP